MYGEIFSDKIGTARKYSELYEFVGVVEPDDQQWNQVKATGPYNGVPRMTQEQLLNVEGLQLICIETEVKDLIETAQVSVEAGMHIHLDKPAGTNYSSFEKLVQTAKSQERIVQMGYMFRYNPGFQFIFHGFPMIFIAYEFTNMIRIHNCMVLEIYDMMLNDDVVCFFY